MDNRRSSCTPGTAAAAAAEDSNSSRNLRMDSKSGTAGAAKVTAERRKPHHQGHHQHRVAQMFARGPPWLLLAALSTSLGCCLVAALLNSTTTTASSSLRRQASGHVELPPSVSIPERQLGQYDNGSVTFNWWRLHQCISRLNCPPDFFSCQLPEDPAAARPPGLLHLWHLHFLLLGWAFFTCHHVAGMRRLFLEEPSGVDVGLLPAGC